MLFEGFRYDIEGIIAFLDSLIDMERREKDKNKIYTVQGCIRRVQ